MSTTTSIHSKSLLWWKGFVSPLGSVRVSYGYTSGKSDHLDYLTPTSGKPLETQMAGLIEVEKPFGCTKKRRNNFQF